MSPRTHMPTTLTHQQTSIHHTLIRTCTPTRFDTPDLRVSTNSRVNTSSIPRPTFLHTLPSLHTLIPLHPHLYKHPYLYASIPRCIRKCTPHVSKHLSQCTHIVQAYTATRPYTLMSPYLQTT